MPNFYICSICGEQKHYNEAKVTATLKQVPGYRLKNKPPHTHGTADQVNLICPGCAAKQPKQSANEVETLSVKKIEGRYQVERI
jgi:hypothetical protein